MALLETSPCAARGGAVLTLPRGLTFDEATHVFRRSRLGRTVEVPSVTSVLKRCGLITPAEQARWTEAARARGIRVHRALYLLQRQSDDAALFTLEPEDIAYYEAGKLALNTFGIDVLAVEELVDGESYAGWLDLRCRLRGESLPVVLDFKSGSVPAYAPLQLSGYAAPLDAQHRRGVIVLQRNGDPKLIMFRDDLADARLWKAALTVALLQIEWEGKSVERCTL